MGGNHGPVGVFQSILVPQDILFADITSCDI